MTNNTLNEMVRFQTDRNLHTKEFNLKEASMNILEEIMEAHGIKDSDKTRNFKRKEEVYNKMLDVINDTIMVNPELFQLATDEDMVDAFCDIQEYAIGEPLKLGYNSIECLNEMTKEINSREGEFRNGKFEKSMTPESIAKHYKANFKACKI